MNFDKKESYNINDLLEIIKLLRSEDGCPWDKIQTHKSIRNNFIEEVYEVAEAIDENDDPLLREELGDVLMQVVFHSDIARSEGRFNFDNVCDGVCKKLIKRHPHIFEDINEDDPEQVLKNWDAIKRQSKNNQTVTQSLKTVTKTLPQLMRAQKLVSRTEKSGNYLPIDIQKSLDNSAKDIFNLKEDKLFEEIGDFLFAISAKALYHGIDCEEALSKASDRFIERFEEKENKSSL